MPSLRHLLWPLLACLPLESLTAQPLPSPGGHPIEYALDDCMEQGEWQPSVMRECAATAESRWQDEVAQLTARLAQVLGREAREALEASDDAWQRALDADLALIDAYHAQLVEAELGDPALLPLARQLHRNAVLEERALRLRRFLDGLEALEMPAEAPSAP
ncbi:hypothetical protein BDK63_000253 [Halomonas campaniensis]|uniref:Lysozyme inhibitor LprI N-terminal domain-containing protein n=1 Tax=Halomonas campaniensis TaxID=213554 RepID=A0A7W5JZX5_9GAMM|nr:lysozyme inhibitor LprI family protein [Halomonas campaniensis]MBB3329413.1 hypothetical protein [Halomonas campaniensis]